MSGLQTRCKKVGPAAGEKKGSEILKRKKDERSHKPPLPRTDDETKRDVNVTRYEWRDRVQLLDSRNQAPIRLDSRCHQAKNSIQGSHDLSGDLHSNLVS